MRIGLPEANQRFSRVVKAVKAGRQVVLTERGKPIAVVKPLPDTSTGADWLDRLEAAGLLRRAAKPGPMPPCKALRIKGPPISETLREERDEW